MTLPAPPHPSPPTDGHGPWAGPSAWPRPPRWLGAGTVVRLAGRERRHRRLSTAVGAIGGLLAGAALAGGFGHGAARALAAAVLLTLAAALADTTDPTQREEADLLVRLGAPRLVVRAAAWLGAVAVVGLPAATGAWVVGQLRAVEVALRGPSFGDGPGSALFLVAAGAAATAGTRLGERDGRNRAVSTARRVIRAVASTLLILLGALLPSTSTSGTDVDFSFTFGVLLVIVGLVGIAPILVRATTWLGGALPWRSLRLASATLASQRRGLTITIALVASLAAILVAQTTLGEGLGAREQARVEALRSLGPATIAGSDRVLVVDRSAERAFAGSDRTPPSTAEATPRGAIGAPVHLLPVDVSAPGGVLGNATPRTAELFSGGRGAVALARPDLLRALGLDPALASGRRALVLDRRVLDAQGQVRFIAPPNSDDPGPTPRQRGVLRPAVAAAPDGPWVGLPSVLLPQAMFDDLPAAVRRPRPLDLRTTPEDVVLRFARRPSSAQVDALYRRLPDADISRGDEGVDLTHKDRTDRMATIWVRTRSESTGLALSMAAIGVVGLAMALVTIRLATRRSDQLLHVLGARRRTTALVGALRGGLLAVGATAFGAGIGLAATWWGIHRYDTRGRLQAQVVLAPIGFHLPPVAVAGLLAMPLAAGALGAVLALLGPASPPGRTSGRDDR